jgi:hypothetical protein
MGLNGALKAVTMSDFPIHSVKQTLDGATTEVQIKHRFMAPLYTEDNQLYFFNAFRVISAH